MTEYITKERALEAVTRNLPLYGDEWVAAYNIVGAIPPEDVAPVVHARWETPMALIQCSHCGFGMFPDGYYFDHGVCVHANESWFGPDYCPQCGARMDGEDK